MKHRVDTGPDVTERQTATTTMSSRREISRRVGHAAAFSTSRMNVRRISTADHTQILRRRTGKTKKRVKKRLSSQKLQEVTRSELFPTTTIIIIIIETTTRNACSSTETHGTVSTAGRQVTYQLTADRVDRPPEKPEHATSVARLDI